MHMFFVAFNHRQNKIVHQVERAEMLAMANDKQNMILLDSGETPDKSFDLGEQKKQTDEEKAAASASLVLASS